MNWPSLVSTDHLWPIAVGAVCNASCALLGCYLVLRRLSLLGDAISHGVLPGIVLGFLATGSLNPLPIFLGALALGMLTAFLTHTLHTFGKVAEDASMGVVFTSLFALGIVLITQFASKAHLDANCMLYGSLVFADLHTTSLFGWKVPRVFPGLLLTLGGSILFVLLFWKELKISSFDPQLATAMGFNATFMHYLLMGLVAAVTVAAFEAVGPVLVVAMLIVPAAVAHLLTDRLAWMMIVSVFVGVFSAAGGYYGALYFDTTSVAGMIAVTVGLVFAVVVLIAPRHGLISKAYHNLALSVRIAQEDVMAMLYRTEEKISQPAVEWNQCLLAGGGGLAAWLAVPKLCLSGQIHRQQGWKFALSAIGREYAQAIIRSHRLWEAYLVQHFDLPLDHLHEPASRLEHFIGPDLQKELETELAQPGKDPHGQPIPPK